MKPREVQEDRDALRKSLATITDVTRSFPGRPSKSARHKARKIAQKALAASYFREN